MWRGIRFVQIERPGLIVFDFRVDEAPEEPTRVTVTFTPEGDGCSVILSHDLAPAWAAYAERSAAGWSTILDSLSAVADARS
ncbi:SRPBCC family protein [Brevundimonas goettingensis]|uniref:SRPBCC domain-containing protein n=1 Tax=Brevundimonas goettingensis TaxID=2774190 RepID=A0A975C7T1_9CAUL|nr:SRPBCC domain-containing protein [Brevundimonas goettingensis]QTC93127.1 SRPBCC domain-containing protein [Brevundimonas goettingensis]